MFPAFFSLKKNNILYDVIFYLFYQEDYVDITNNLLLVIDEIVYTQ